MAKRTASRAAVAMGSGAVLALGTISGWYLVTPRRTVEAMADAAAHGRSDILVRYMDMPALRADMRRRAARAIAQGYPPGRVVLNPRVVVEALAGPQIDRMFSLDGTRRVVERSKRRHVDMAVRFSILRGGADHFTARLDEPRPVDLLFTRKGVSWRLTGIRPRATRTPRAEEMA